MDDDIDPWRVSCASCGTAGRYATTEQEAVAHWNSLTTIANATGASATEPRHDGPRCPACKVGTLMPIRHQGDNRPLLHRLQPRDARGSSADNTMLECAHCGAMDAKGAELRGLREQTAWQCGNCGATNKGRDLAALCDECGVDGSTTPEQADALRALQALEAKAHELRRTEPEACAACGAPATCLGSYEYGVTDEDEEFACDEHCDHGNKGGHCEPLVTRDENLANLSALFLSLSECVQHLAPEHDEAGAHFEELAVICQRSVVASAKAGE